MIDEDRTLQLYGYTSDALSHGSRKPIVAVCEECGRYAIRCKRDYRHTCHLCAMKDPERCARISAANKNPSEETRVRRSRARIGDKHWNWQGGISGWRDVLIHSMLYKNWRAAVFERDNYTCQMCDDATGGNLQAHHIRPIRDHKNDLTIWNVDNGITLCKKCHVKVNWKENEFIERFDSIIEQGG